MLQGHRSNQVMLGKILVQFHDLFQQPTGLPPQCAHDHWICLQPGTGPVVVRPYHYPYFQKDEIEWQCNATLQQGIIQPNRSLFSSPVLLVRKQDGTWWFYVDYQELNSKMVKDKFPVPVVDEPLDELYGSKFFTELDLRSGYHQFAWIQVMWRKRPLEHFTFTATLSFS